MNRLLRLITAAAGLAACAVWPCLAAEPAAKAENLASYNADPAMVSVSGLSSGAFMAVQFEVAHSDAVMGAAAVAGGPYYCGQGSLQTMLVRCSCPLETACPWSMTSHVPSLVQKTQEFAAGKQIAPPENLKNHRVWLFSGTRDTKVPQSVSNDLETYYRAFVKPENISYINTIPAEHAMPIEGGHPRQPFGNECAYRGDPFINNCHYDAAGSLLSWIYGTLNLPQQGALTGTFKTFPQEEFIAEPAKHGMAQTGWLYVPKACEDSQQQCRLHVAFHGCRQAPNFQACSGPGCPAPFGDLFVKHAGYNAWADTNSIIVLYPQAEPDGQKNPKGCWDIWGYDGPGYATRASRQISAVKGMISRITGQAQSK